MTAQELRAGIEKAFDFRGDVTITRTDGSVIEGYLFDRRTGETLESSFIRVFPKDSTNKVAIAYADVAEVVFSGRDPAEGKSWQAWVKKYVEKKAAGETHIALEPESLD